MVKAISILGCTGSIGRQTLDIIDNLRLPVCALTAGTNVMRMAEQDSELLNTIYKEVSEKLGMDTAMEIYQMFKGKFVHIKKRACGGCRRLSKKGRSVEVQLVVGLAAVLVNDGNGGNILLLLEHFPASAHSDGGA